MRMVKNKGNIIRTTATKYSLDEWLAEGERRFGTDKRLWKWKCSNCGHVQSIADFIELKNQNMISADVDVGQLAYFSCIGRYDTRIPKDKIGTIFDEKESKKEPCNYTLGGLFCFAKTYVIDYGGEEHPVFDFADV